MSNAIQLRDASDVTTLKKQRAIQRNYEQLQDKNQLPIGGIPHSDLMAVARYGATYIPTDSLIPTVLGQNTSCALCPNSVSYETSEIVSEHCGSNCNGSSFQLEQYVKLFRQQ